MIYRIKKELLEMIMESSRDMFPDEFAAFLRGEGGVIYELLMLPGTISGRRSATYQLYMKPIDFTVVGTVHSHPSGVTLPSDEDILLFSRTGDIHIIVGFPFRMNDFSAYDRNGKRVELEVI